MPLPQASAPARPGTRHAHLLASAYRRINALCPALDVAIVAAGRPPRPGWVDGDALLAKSDLAEAFLDAVAANTTKRYGQKARPDVVATKALHGYLWSICLLMSGPWYLQRRVPLLRPADLRVELATGRLAVAPGAFACLPEDPASALPDVRVLPHEAALRAELLRAVADHGQIKGDQVTGFYDDAAKVMADVAAAGVDYDDVISVLIKEGVEKFVTAWDDLLDTVKASMEAATK